MIEATDLSTMRKYITRCVGERVQLLANQGRRKAVVREGVIENAYPSIFTIRVINEFNSSRRLSFSYTDLLTNVVELVLCKNDGETSLGEQQVIQAETVSAAEPGNEAVVETAPELVSETESAVVIGVIDGANALAGVAE